MSATHEGNLIEEHLDPTGARRLKFVARLDGAVGYVEEFRETYIEPDDEYSGLEVWDVVQVSGLFPDIEAARSDARVMTHWARQSIENRRT